MCPLDKFDLVIFFSIHHSHVNLTYHGAILEHHTKPIFLGVILKHLHKVLQLSTFDL